MQYAVLKSDGTYDYQVNTKGNVQWDANNFCTAEALVKDGKAAQFRVVELVQIDPPTFDPITEIAVRDGGEFVNGRWQYKWRVDTLSPEQAAAKLAAARAAKVEQIKAVRDQRTREGGVPAGGKWFHSDVYTRSQFQELARRGPNIPSIPWRTMDGTDITMTPALVLEILDSFFAQELNTFNRGKELEFFANTEPNPSGLVLNGWPPIFGE